MSEEEIPLSQQTGAYSSGASIATSSNLRVPIVALAPITQAPGRKAMTAGDVGRKLQIASLWADYAGAKPQLQGIIKHTSAR